MPAYLAQRPAVNSLQKPFHTRGNRFRFICGDLNFLFWFFLLWHSVAFPRRLRLFACLLDLYYTFADYCTAALCCWLHARLYDFIWINLKLFLQLKIFFLYFTLAVFVSQFADFASHIWIYVLLLSCERWQSSGWQLLGWALLIKIY